MNKELMNLFIFLILLFFGYLLFNNLNLLKLKREGMTDASGNIITVQTNGIAGNADAYGAEIKLETIKMQDMFLVSKYRNQYETVILNLDDFVNNLMLKSALSMDKINPHASLSQLAELNQVKNALNNVMIFLDKTT
jgi:hypothetical protein